MENGQDDGYEYQERSSNDTTNHADIQARKRYVLSSPDRRRSEPVPFRDMEIKSERATIVKGVPGNPGDYRDTTVFSDEGPSPIGMPCPMVVDGVV